MNKKIFEEIEKKDSDKQLKLNVINCAGVQVIADDKWLKDFHEAVKEEFNKTFKVSSNSDYTKMMKQRMINSGNFKKVK
jgi:hypothetical protein